MEPSLSYTYRRHAFEKSTTARLTQDALEFSREDGFERKVSLRDIKGVRLKYAPCRYERERYLCEVSLRSGEKFTIPSTSYIRLAVFRRQNEEYKNFITLLHRELTKLEQRPRFLAGASALYYLFNAGCLVLAVLMVFFLVFVIGGAAFNYMSATSWVKVAVILVLLPAAIAFIKRNVPREYDPERIPEDLMPSASA